MEKINYASKSYLYTMKKGALELSIGTIVIIVLAVTMLVLGIIFVKSIMCSGIVISEELSTGVKNEIRTLFGADKYGVKCVGEGQDIKFGTGGVRQIVCMIKTEQETEYDLIVKNIESLKGTPTKKVEEWVIGKDWLKKKVSPGGSGAEAVVLLLDIPKDAPTTMLEIEILAKNKDLGTEESHVSYINIVPTGFLKTTLC